MERRARKQHTGRQKDAVGLAWIRDDGEWAKETNHARDERIDRGFNRWNIVGMNERALCVCVCVRVCEKSGRG